MDLTSVITVFATCGVLFMMHEIKGCQGQDLIGPIDDKQAVLRGNTHTFTCSRRTGVNNRVSWYGDVPGENPLLISFGDEIVAPQDPGSKYANFAIGSPDADTFNLVINTAADEDEGFYYCGLLGTAGTTTISDTVTFTVEVEATSISMTQDGNPVTTVTVTEGETSEIVCTALGARPIVKIWWYHQQDGESENRIMAGVIQTNTSNGDGTFDVVSTLQYTPGNTDYNDGTIRCESTRQLVATPVNAAATLSVQYIPIVSVQYGGDKAICSSDANPDVPLKGYTDMQGYIFIVNDTEEYAPTECSDGQCTLNLKVKFNTDVRCNATNSIGTGIDTTVAVPGAVITTTPEPTTPGRGTTIGGEVICNDTIHVAFLVILSLLLVVSLVFNIVVVIRYNRLLKSGKMSNSQTHMESRTPNPTNLAAGGDQYQELNMKSREKEHAYQQPDLSGLPQRVENEQGSMYEDLNNPSNDNQPTYEVAGDEVKAGGNQQSPMYVNARPIRPRHGKQDK